MIRRDTASGGLPAEEHLPLDAVTEAFERVFAGSKQALQYGMTEGFTPLREAIAERMRSKGMAVETDQVLLTTGLQQAIDLLSRVRLKPGDAVLVQIRKA